MNELTTELDRIEKAKADIKTAIENKGVIVGNGTIDTYASKIDEIKKKAYTGKGYFYTNGVHTIGPNWDGWDTVVINVGGLPAKPALDWSKTRYTDEDIRNAQLYCPDLTQNDITYMLDLQAKLDKGDNWPVLWDNHLTKLAPKFDTTVWESWKEHKGTYLKMFLGSDFEFIPSIFLMGDCEDMFYDGYGDKKVAPQKLKYANFYRQSHSDLTQPRMASMDSLETIVIGENADWPVVDKKTLPKLKRIISCYNYFNFTYPPDRGQLDNLGHTEVYESGRQRLADYLKDPDTIFYFSSGGERKVIIYKDGKSLRGEQNLTIKGKKYERIDNGNEYVWNIDFDYKFDMPYGVAIELDGNVIGFASKTNRTTILTIGDNSRYFHKTDGRGEYDVNANTYFESKPINGEKCMVAMPQMFNLPIGYVKLEYSYSIPDEYANNNNLFVFNYNCDDWQADKSWLDVINLDTGKEPKFSTEATSYLSKDTIYVPTNHIRIKANVVNRANGQEGFCPKKPYIYMLDTGYYSFPKDI